MHSSKMHPHEGKTARNLELESAILRNPEDNAAWQVYGDFLQDEGDQRGELIAYAMSKQVHLPRLDINAVYGEVLAEAAAHNEVAAAVATSSRAVQIKDISFGDFGDAESPDENEMARTPWGESPA
jgi:uncharacterized protein (TIGR02996 family)